VALRSRARPLLAVRRQSPTARVAVAVAMLGGLTAVGALGFALIHDLPPVDALYMAVTTLSTVGYQELAPATAAGRLWTIGFIVIGVGVTFYAIVSLAEFLIEGRLQAVLGRRAMEKRIQSLSDHVIVCGYGRLGRSVVEALAKDATPVIVVEQDGATVDALQEAGILHVHGSAAEDDVLRAAGIERARTIVIATSSDAENVFIALSARELNPEVVVHARAETEPGLRRLRRAGADQVVSLHAEGGRRIAHAILRPAVVDVFELAAGTDQPIRMEEVELDPGCPLVGCALGELAERGIQVGVVVLQREGETPRVNPDTGTRLRAGDRIVVVGESDALARMASEAQGPES